MSAVAGYVSGWVARCLVKLAADAVEPHAVGAVIRLEGGCQVAGVLWSRTPWLVEKTAREAVALYVRPVDVGDWEAWLKCASEELLAGIGVEA